VRGRSRSIAPEAAVGEINDLVSRGYKEVVLSGIHLGSYGRDLKQKTSFCELISRVLASSSIERIRLSSIEPLEVIPDLISLAADDLRIARHFHIPLQSGSACILRAMYRPYTPEYYSDLLDRIRRRIPEAGLGADVMVGFPGETDDDFLSTYRLIEESPLTYLHVFPYSARPGTPAAAMSNAIPDHVVRFRADALRRLIRGKNEAFRRALVGHDVHVLALEKGLAISTNFVRVSVPDAAPINQWIRVRVTAITPDGVSAY
jgi:threonylcarbamoyladenosine tRNA methylthiotransferase MtaB